MGNRDDDDWSIETGQVHEAECLHCDRVCDKRYCQTCRATGVADTSHGVATYEARDAW